ncbi:serine/arginine repetitive matrix protein 4-like isoform X3 [Limulus polyphemus]|uniref:Serine/arginine repetitive matrix protein 4-like isoform X3 n=1 Tax=Limulus polyphemus TaxID=6850 RepID=A0ABM1SCM5_LIMPO|nr:serine/arginine repetitive matrix protein 4-like isoform X3 [Limulus polyphemus]
MDKVYVSSVKESHQMAEVNREENDKLKETLGMCEHFIEDGSIDTAHRQKKDQNKYILVLDSISSSSPEREKGKIPIKYEEKDGKVLHGKKRRTKKYYKERSTSAMSLRKRKYSDKRKKSSKNHRKHKKLHRSSSESSNSSTSSSDNSDNSQSSSNSSGEPDSSSDSGSKRHKQKHSKHVKKGASGHDKKKKKNVKKLVKEGKPHRKEQENSNELSKHFSSLVPLSPKPLPHFSVEEHSQSARKHDYHIRKCVKQSSSEIDKLNLGDMTFYKQKKLKVFCSSSEEKETRKNKKKIRRKSSSFINSLSCVQEFTKKKKKYNKHHSRTNERTCCINNKIQKLQEKNKTEQRKPRKKSATPQMQQHQDSHSLICFPVPNIVARSQSEAVSASKLNLKRRKRNRYQDETSRSSLPEQGEKKAERLKNYSIKSPQSDYKFDYRKGETDYISVRKIKDPFRIEDRKETYPYAQEVIKYHKSHSINHIGKIDGLDCSSSLPSSSLQALAQNAKKFSKSGSEEYRSQQTVSQSPKAQKKRHSKSLFQSTLQSRSSSESHHSSAHSKSRTSFSRRDHSNCSRRSVPLTQSRSSSETHQSRSRSRSSRKSSRSPSIPKRRGSPSFLEKRRITSARKCPVPYHRPSPLTPSSLSSWSYKSKSRSKSLSPYYLQSCLRSRSISHSPRSNHSWAALSRIYRSDRLDSPRR